MMNAKRATIGRTFDHSSFLTSNAGDNFSQIFILASGKRAEFTFQKIPAQEVTDKTFVTVENNGRDQDALTHESLKDITRTIRLQQFFPAIGRRIGERIEIIDGSRRRAAAILCQTGLSVLVTDTEISGEDWLKIFRQQKSIICVK